MIWANFSHHHIDISASNSTWYFFESTGNCKKPNSESIYGHIRFYRPPNFVFCDFPWIKKNTTLSLMLKYQWGDVKSWLKSWNEHFASSDPPRFGPKMVLFLTAGLVRPVLNETKVVIFFFFISSESSQNISSLVLSCLFCPVMSNHIESSQILANPVGSYCIKSNPITSCWILSNQVKSV